MLCWRRISAIGTPASPCFRISTIWLSVNRDFRMGISLAPESLRSKCLPKGEAYDYIPVTWITFGLDYSLWGMKSYARDDVLILHNEFFECQARLCGFGTVTHGRNRRSRAKIATDRGTRGA